MNLESHQTQARPIAYDPESIDDNDQGDACNRVILPALSCRFRSNHRQGDVLT